MSKNFPEAYDHNTNCEWNINVEEGQKIKLTFHLFNVSIITITFILLQTSI